MLASRDDTFDAMTSETELPTGWAIVDGKLRREVRFGDFSEAWAFMTRVALLAEKRDHHPDWSNSWNVVTIELVSHDTGVVSDRDRALAAEISTLIESSGPG